MPILIDTTSDNLDEQLQQVNKNLAIHKQVDAKYFSKSMTGNGKRKTGLFSTDADSITDFMKNSRRLLDGVAVNNIHNQNEENYSKNAFGNFFNQSSKEKETEFKEFENNLTCMLPPILLNPLLNDNAPITLSFPKQIGMFNLNALEDTWTKITSGTIDGTPASTYVKPVVQSMRLYAREQQHQLQSGQVSKETQVAGQADMYVLFATVLDDMDKDGDIVFANQRVNNGSMVTTSQGVASIAKLPEKSKTEYDYRNIRALLKLHLTKIIGNQNVKIKTLTEKELISAIGDQSMSDLLKGEATTMTHQAEDTILTFIQSFAEQAKALIADPSTSRSIIQKLTNTFTAFVQDLDVLNGIEDNIITTDLLASIYQVLNDNITDRKLLDGIARHSLRLLLSQRLYELKEIRDNGGLYKFEPKNQQVTQAMQQNTDYSTQQKKIIMSVDPLVIGQAGAGSGKSHTLVGRINYMKDQGEDLSKVLVLSFTNVAAININNRFPGVRSETLANMFHTIYNATYPTQSLSQPSTVANSLRLLNPASQYFKGLGLNENELRGFISRFADRLENFDQTGFKRVDLQQELKQLSNVIEENLPMTIAVLNAVEQTTLELEPIIIHHKLLHGGDDLAIPQDYRDLNYIITDESQDISTFEYILLLELTIHYGSQLCIIGDGSQTLYEFRNSDPRYMNALEASNVFTSHKLETNYRSNQEILTYANQFLQVIDANKYANIQLTSAQFSTPTKESVYEAITIGQNELSGGGSKEYSEGVKDYLENSEDFEEWFIDRVKKGEQVALMGWTRKEVTTAGEAIEKLLHANGLGHIPITNIMSDNERPMTLLSRFARRKCEDLRKMNPNLPTYGATMEEHVKSFVEKSFKHASPKQSAFYNDFINRNIKAVTDSPQWKAGLVDYRKGSVSEYQIGSYLIQQLLRMETRKNAMDQFLRKQKDVPNYDKCPIILSTIHGTKGLEFDHTVILFNEAKRGSTSQESLRMMFVALSRAKKSEFIINSFRPSATRVTSDNLSAMYQTPIDTAFMRTLNDVCGPAQTATTADVS